MRALILALAALAGPAAAQEDPLAVQAFDHFYNLEFDEAIEEFQRAIALDPKSPDLHNHLAESIVFREMFRDGALESEMVSGNNSFLRRPKLNPAAGNREMVSGRGGQGHGAGGCPVARQPQRRCGALRRRDLLWAAVELLLGGEEVLARFAERRHQRAPPAQPRVASCSPAMWMRGWCRDWTITLSAACRWRFGCWASWPGSTATRKRAFARSRTWRQNGKDNRVDAQVFLCALYRRENQPRKAIPLVQDLIRRYPRNFLLRMELAQMYSVAGDGTSALSVLQEVARMKTNHAPGYDRVPWEKIYFQEGTIQFWYRDLNAALENMKKVTAAANELDLNTGSFAYLRMGQIYDLTNRRPLALAAYRKAIAYAPDAEAAQEAKKYLSTPYRRM